MSWGEAWAIHSETCLEGGTGTDFPGISEVRWRWVWIWFAHFQLRPGVETLISVPCL